MLIHHIQLINKLPVRPQQALHQCFCREKAENNFLQFLTKIP